MGEPNCDIEAIEEKIRVILRESHLKCRTAKSILRYLLEEAEDRSLYEK